MKNVKSYFKRIEYWLNSKRYYLSKIQQPNLVETIREKQTLPQEYKNILNKKLTPNWFSKREIFYVSLLLILIFALLFVEIDINLYGKSINLDRYTLISVHAGIGAALVGLIFLVANSINDIGTKYRRFVLFRRTSLLGLFVLEIITFFLTLFAPIDKIYLLLILVVIVGVATIGSFYQLINLASSDYALKQEEAKLFFAEIRTYFLKSLDFEITKRLANNHLAGLFKKIPEIAEVNPFSPLDKKKYIAYEEEKQGLITNVRVGKLHKLIHELASSRNVNVFDIEKVGSETKDDRQKNEPLLYISGLVHSHTKYHGQKLFYIKKEEDSHNEEKYLEQLRGIYVIDDKLDFEKEARSSLIELKNKCITSVRKMESEELSESINFYVQLVGEYHQMMSCYGGGFSYEQAQQERGSFLDRLNSIAWIIEDVRDIFDATVVSSNKDMIREAGYLPIRIAKDSIKYNDHYIFQEFISFSKILYYSSIEKRKNGEVNVSNFMRDRSWRYLKEFSSFYLEREDAIDEENLMNYGIFILKLFQDLIKLSIDHDDYQGFAEFVDQSIQLFSSLEREYRYDRDEDNIYENLDRKRNEMFFGVASWLLFSLQRNPENESILKMFNFIKSKLPQNIKDFSLLFNQVHSFDVENFWGWDHWETALYPEGRVHSIQILEKLEVLFAVHSLKLLRSKTDEEVENMQLDTSRDLAYLAEGSRSLISTLDKIKSDSNNWHFALDDQSIAQVENFKKLLNKAKQAQEEIDAERKRVANISPEKVTEFKKNLLSNYEQSFPVSELMKAYESYTEKLSESNDSVDAIGINTLFDKAAFFGKDIGWHVHYTGNDDAFGFGRSMSQGENKKVFEILKEASNKISQEKMDDFFKGKELDDYIILTTNNAVWRAFEYEKENYIPKWRQDFPTDEEYSKAEGVLKINETYIPVFIFFVSDSDLSDVYILNKKELGEFTHWKPLNESDVLTGVFDIQIITLEEGSEETNRMLKNPPEWLSEIDGEDPRLKYLQERLIIKIFEKFSYLPGDNFDGVYIEIEK